MPLVEGSEDTSTPCGPLVVSMPATAQDLLRCLRLDRHFSFSVSVLWMTKFSSPNNVAASSFHYAIHFAL